MSQENVDAFRRAVDAANRRDTEAVLAECGPNVEWHAVLPVVGGDMVYRGHEGVREFLRDLWEVLADSKLVFPQITDLGDRLIATGHLSGRGAQSGAETRTPFAYVVEYENHKAILVRAYLDPGEALEAAGLSE